MSRFRDSAAAGVLARMGYALLAAVGVVSGLCVVALLTGLLP